MSWSFAIISQPSRSKSIKRSCNKTHAQLIPCQLKSPRKIRASSLKRYVLGGVFSAQTSRDIIYSPVEVSGVFRNEVIIGRRERKLARPPAQKFNEDKNYESFTALITRRSRKTLSSTNAVEVSDEEYSSYAICKSSHTSRGRIFLGR